MHILLRRIGTIFFAPNVPGTLALLVCLAGTPHINHSKGAVHAFAR